MKLIEVLCQIPKLNKDILISAPKIEATKEDVYDYLTESGFLIEFSKAERAVEQAKRLLAYYEEINVLLCNIQDDEYSKALKEIDTPPAVLYYRGNISKLNQMKTVAVIGTRHPSKECEKISFNLGNVLSEKGYGVVNGLALGCDTEAMKGCLAASGSYPVAIMPGGVDDIYPKSNKEIAEEIISKGGCLISEYPPNTSIQKYMYVQRDRIQAGLSDGVIMVEAMKDSGTMHTINYAKQYNRNIACYKEKSNVFTGNSYLIDSGVQALENDKDLQLFENNLGNGRFRQVSLFD